MNENERLPLIFDIRHFALDDGPGIRTTVFLKGCPLSCIWCQNPESIKTGREIAFYPRLCIGCGDCEALCQEGAISLKDPARIIRDRCTACGKCAEECPTTALKIVGQYYTVDELVDILLSDRIFYDTSKGGVTFSGGEPTLFMDYVGKVMKALKGEDIHIVLQTAGMFDLDRFKAKLLPYIDLLFFDIKLLDSSKHRKYTGKDNMKILHNFSELVKKANTKIIPRVPLVPGITATTENVTSIAAFLKSNRCTTCKPLPYNPGGISKRTAIGQEVPEEIPHNMMETSEEKRLKLILKL